LNSRILSEKEERELQRELELLHQKKAIAIDEAKNMKKQAESSNHSSPSKKTKNQQ